MVTKYKTDRFNPSKITAVECTRESAQCVWIARSNGIEDRSAKASEWGVFHDSWEAAHAYLLEQAELAVSNARHRLEVARGTLGNVKGMKKPAA